MRNLGFVQKEVKEIFENISVFLGGIFTTTERRGRREIEQSQIGPKGEGVGTSESKKGRTRRQRRKKTGWELECGNGGGLAAQLGRFGKTTLPVLM